MTTADAGRKLVTRGAQFSIGPLTRAVGALLLLPLMTRVLSSDALGLVSTAQVTTNVLVAIAALGLHSAAMREYFGTDAQFGDPHLARALSVAAVSSTIVIAIVAHLTGPSWVRAFGGVSYSNAMVLAVLVTIPMSLHVVGLNLLRAEDRPRPFTVAVLVATLGGQFLGIGLAATGDGTATEYLIGVTIGFAVGGLIASGSAGLRGRRLSQAELASGLRLGLPTIPHSLGIFLLQMGDRIVIIRVDGLEAVGRYQVAYLIGSAGIMAIIAFSAAWTPMIFRISGDENRWHTLAETTGMMHWLTGLVCAGLVLTAPVALRIAAPASYDTEGLVNIVSIVAPSAVFYVTFQSASMVFFQMRRTGPLGITSLLAAVGNLGLNFLLVTEWGLAGAALATTITYAVWALAVRWIAGQIVTVKWDDRAFAGSFILVAATLTLCTVIGVSDTALIVRFIFGLGAGAAALLVVKRQR